MLAKDHNCTIAYRQLHDPQGSFCYEKPCTVPEMGVCLEALHKLSIDRFGNVSPCVRFDPKGEHILNNISKESLYDIWNGKHQELRKQHVDNKIDFNPCKNCNDWQVGLS